MNKILKKIKNIQRKIVYKFFFSFINKLNLYIEEVDCEPSVNIVGLIFIDNQGKIKIGKNTCIHSCDLVYLASSVQSRLLTMPKAEIIIGENCGISNVNICAYKKIEIGNKVFLGTGCEIFDTDFHSLKLKERLSQPDPGIKSKPIKICDGAFIGAYALIMKGVTIGENSVIGAGSVVTKDVPPNEIWAGNPAKFIKKIENENKEKILEML